MAPRLRLTREIHRQAGRAAEMVGVEKNQQAHGRETGKRVKGAASDAPSGRGKGRTDYAIKGNPLPGIFRQGMGEPGNRENSAGSPPRRARGLTATAAATADQAQRRQTESQKRKGGRFGNDLALDRRGRYSTSRCRTRGSSEAPDRHTTGSR